MWLICYNRYGDIMIKIDDNFNWNLFLQPYQLAVEDFILKIEGIKQQYIMENLYSPIEIVSGRVKSPASILDKAKRMGVQKEYVDEKLYDIGGVRITCKYLTDIFDVADLIKQRKDLEVLEIRDYVNNPKPSGYRSLHIISRYYVETLKGAKPVIIEFQIRTHAMHFWASIEHSLKYKYQKKIPEEIKERLVSAAKAAELLDKEMTSIKNAIDELDKEGGSVNLIDPLENEVTLRSRRNYD